MKLLLLGAPGSGKGTQSAMICGKYNLPHISTGDIFRENIKQGTELGKKVQEIISGGNLAPDSLTVEIVKDRLAKPDCQNGFVLDGFPRNLYQAKALEEFGAPDLVVNFDIEKEVIIERISGRRVCKSCSETYHTDFIGNSLVCEKCGGELYIRKDDNPQSVEERLKVYATQTQPLIDYYEKQGKLVTINSGRYSKEVFADIVKVLG
jgi:adenylate kinase